MHFQKLNLKMKRASMLELIKEVPVFFHITYSFVAVRKSVERRGAEEIWEMNYSQSFQTLYRVYKCNLMQSF